MRKSDEVLHIIGRESRGLKFNIGGQWHFIGFLLHSTDDGILLSCSTYNILLVGCRLDVDLEFVFVWSRNNEFVYIYVGEDKVRRRIVPFSPKWESAVQTLANRPTGRFARKNHINIQVTQPGSGTVTPLHQYRRIKN
jgi:hypothetical protein